MENRVGIGGLRSCRGWGTDAASPLSGVCFSVLKLAELQKAVCSCLLDSGLRPGSASLYTGDSRRKARQPRGGPKGAGSDWSEATSCTFWQLRRSARLRPLCALLPELPLFLAKRSNLTFSSFSPRLLLEVRAQVCPIFYLFGGSQSLRGLEGMLVKNCARKTIL